MDQPIKLQEYIIANEYIENKVRLLLITDLHSSQYGDKQRQLLDLVRDAKPDLVCYAGDIFDKKRPEQNSLLVLDALAAAYPCFYITGNHEFKRGQADDLMALVRSLGINVLEGTWAKHDIRGQRIIISGIDDPMAGEEAFATQLESCVPGEEETGYRVLLTHRPERINRYLDYHFDLVLAGHAHGGQWRIPGIMNGLFAPHQGLFPKYAGGRYDFDRATMIVSRGLAKDVTIVPRIFNPPEIAVIDLEPKTNRNNR